MRLKPKVVELSQVHTPIWEKPDPMDKWMKKLEGSANLPLLI